jgi:hypothetical protein
MFIDYNPHIDRFVIYPHTRDYAGPTGTEQATLRLVTNDFVTYEALGVGGSSASAIVVCGQGNHHGYAYGHRFQGNLLLQHRICGGFGYLEGASIALDDLGSVFLPLPDYTRPSAIQTIFDDPEDVQHGSQLIIMLGGRPWAIIMRRPSADEALQQRGDDIWIAPLADDYRTMTGKPVQIIARGGTGAIDEIAAHVPGALVTQNAVYIYYSAEANTTWAQVIAVARCRIYKDGTYDT